MYDSFENSLTVHIYFYFFHSTPHNTVKVIYLLQFPPAPPCNLPFKIVEGVGCISLIEEKKLISDARNECPAGSSLIVPFSGNTLRTLSKHLLDSGKYKCDAAYSTLVQYYLL